jgi:two-component system, NarL family, response regulator DesR
MVIRTLVSERVALIRAGLVVLLATQPDIEVVAALDRAELVVPTASTSRPDVAVINEDIAGHGFAIIRALREAVPACGSIIMASGHSPCKLREAVAASADGFVLKESAPEKITEAIRQVAIGGKVLDPHLAFSALNAETNPLTSREVDVLRLAAEGRLTTEIADELYLSVGTVRNYLSRIIGKTGARSRVEAIRIAKDSGWL